MLSKGLLVSVCSLVFVWSAFSQTRPDAQVNYLVKKKYKKFLASSVKEITDHVTAENLKEIWEELQEEHGKYVSHRFVKYQEVKEESKTSHVFKYKLYFDKDSLSMDITYQYGKIQGFFFRPGREMQVYKSPAYADNRPYYFRSLTTKHPQFPLDAEVIYPRLDSGQKIPLVILVHGSGPSDKDETIGANKPFLDISYGLANEGIAVLRYDKRTFTYGKMLGETPLTIYEEVIEDTKYALALAKSLSFIDTQRIFFAGHSLGAMLMHQVMAANPESAGAMMLCGTFAPLHEVIAYQLVYLDTVGKKTRLSKEAMENAKYYQDLYSPSSFNKLSPSMQTYWKSLQNIEPEAHWNQLKAPLLMLNAGNDYQVPPAFYLPLKAFSTTRPNTTFIEFPQLNHLLMKAEGVNAPAQYFLRGNVAIDVPKSMASWIQQVVLLK